MRAIWAAWKGDGKLNYEGKHYRFTLMTPNFVPEAYDGPAPRIGLAAVGPFMLKVAAEEGDGAKLHVFCTRKYLENKVMPILTEGLAKTGRAREDFEISGGGFVVTGKDDAAVQSCSTGCAIAWPSTARRRPTGRCSRSTGWAISAASSTP